ncbi:flagellar hook protein FlgE [Pseudomonas sp. 148P]|uniref:Flagellar hook protein FlgE n=1 Tax=Pseudomonas ulcerans TaxID=3115852 RepID=A0ABU7I0I4_9PSED|nr:MULTISPECIES: flagellar hook protein FlgE [unclassified Pseudomonas]MEE1920368.1 flagellar hook protein FlgE [Pseudomonas sp. 147P]MEE1937327.1 flagellar hook protein FlgE [Pseudomonas sp. 148P]
MSFNIGLSGLYAASKQLDVTGNNIANVATNGFKSSRAEFQDVYSASKLGVGSKTVGNGVSLAAISQQFGQGDVNNTGNVLDMAIQGQGFFVLSDNGSLTYTRAGAFQTSKDSYVVTSDGLRLQGYAADENGKILTSSLTDLKIDTLSQPPKATSLVTQGINLNSEATPIPLPTATPAGPTFVPTDETTYTKKFSTEIYDTQGNKHTLEQYYRKTDQNTWTMYSLIDGRNPQNPASATPLVGTMTFKSDGSINTMTGSVAPDDSFAVVNNVFTIKGWIPATYNSTTGTWGSNGSAANAGGVRLDMSSTTSYNTDTARLPPTQDGYATGLLSSLSIDSTGVLFASFSNQQSRAIGQVAIASFANEQGLEQMGGTRWKETFASGSAGIDTPKTGTLGSISSNSLEESNVNLTQELVELVKAQSNYQANAKTISTQSAIMQTIIQMT